MDFNQYVKDDALVLSKTTINISELAGFLQSNTHIKKLSLVGSDIIGSFGKVLKGGEFPNLTSLHLRWNKMNSKGVEDLSKALKSGNLPNLTSFHLEGDNTDEFRARALSKALKSGSLSNLTSFRLKGGKIDNFGVIALSKALSELPNLTSFHLKGDNINEYSAIAVSKALSELPKLTSFHFEVGEIDDLGKETLSKALSKLPDFDLRWNEKGGTMLRRGTLKRKSSSEPEVSTASSKQYFKKFKSNEASQQQWAQTQFDQQQKPNAQAASAHSGSRWGKLATMLKRGIFKRKPCLELKVSTTEPEVSTTSSTKSLIPRPKKFKSDEANNQASQQQGAQTQFDQQQKPNAQSTQQQAQATSDSTVPPMSRSRSSSLSSPGGSNNDQPGPSSKLDEVPPISRSQSLNSLHSDDSDIEVISKSQCR